MYAINYTQIKGHYAVSNSIQDLKNLLETLYSNRLAIVVNHHVYRGRGYVDSWCRTYDVAKLLELDEFELGYVERILKSTLENSDSTIDMGTSVKYSFQDCDDWYSSAELTVIPDGYAAKVLYLESYSG